MGGCVILPCVKTPHPLGKRFPYRRKTVMSIQKVNTRSTFKLNEVKVAGKTQPEKRKRVPVVGVAGESLVVFDVAVAKSFKVAGKRMF